MIGLILLAPIVCIFALIFTKDRLQASLCCFGILGLTSLIDIATSTGGHAHNPLGSFTGTFLLIIFAGPLVLIGLCFKKPTEKKKTIKKNPNKQVPLG